MTVQTMLSSKSACSEHGWQLLASAAQIATEGFDELESER